MSFTREETRQIEDIFNDAMIDWNLAKKKEREEWAWQEKQDVPVEDSILMSILLPAWSQDVLETWFQIHWQQELATKTWNNRFSEFTEEQIKPYRVRAGMLLKETSEYLERKEEHRKSHSYLQTGSEVAGYIAWVLDAGSRMG